jgi:hypothetical protein
LQYVAIVLCLEAGTVGATPELNAVLIKAGSKQQIAPNKLLAIATTAFGYFSTCSVLYKTISSSFSSNFFQAVWGLNCQAMPNLCSAICRALAEQVGENSPKHTGRKYNGLM